MEYELYIDVFFLVNLCMDLGLLWLTGRILKNRCGWRRLLLAGGCGAGAACVQALALWLLPAGWRWALEIIWGMLITPAAMVWTAFRPGRIREMVKEVLLFLAVSVCVGGIADALYQHTRAGWFLAELLRGRVPVGRAAAARCFAAAGGFFLFRYVWLTVTEIRREKSNLRTVTLKMKDIRVRTVGFLDTGNRLFEPASGRPVHIVSGELWQKLRTPESRILWIPYRTVGNPGGLMEVMEIDGLRVEGEPPGDPTGKEKEKFSLGPAAETGRKEISLGPAMEAEGKGISLGPAAEAGKEPPGDPVWIGRAPFPLSGDGAYEVLLHEE